MGRKELSNFFGLGEFIVVCVWKIVLISRCSGVVVFMVVCFSEWIFLIVMREVCSLYCLLSVDFGFSLFFGFYKIVC